MASLFIIKGPDQGKRFELDGPVLSLGRDSSNHIQIHDTEVSRRHAELHKSANGFAVVDLGSSNGTYVNTERTPRHELQTGDRVQVGRTVMIFTAQAKHPQKDLSDIVDIVAAHQGRDESRILKSVRQEESSEVLGSGVASSAWLARARSNLQVMYRTALAVSHTLDIDELLARIMDLIFEWVEADRGCIMLVDQESGELMPKVRRTRQGVSSIEKMSISRTILEYVMEQREGVLTSDARDDNRWDPGGSIVKLGVTEAICVPMQGRYGIVGVIYIDTYMPPGRVLKNGASNTFGEDHLKLMVAIGHQAALAVEDTSYYSAMVQAERLAAVGQAIAMLSHHIKNILQGIRGGSYLIEEGLKNEDPNVVRSGWGIVDKNQEKISNLVLDMLTFSKEREPDPVPADLNEITGDVVELMQSRAADAGVRLDWRPEARMPMLTIDPDGLHRAILNVMTNAIDACIESEAGRVDVTTEFDPQAAKARVVISDNGAGIEPDEVKQIFRMFTSTKGNRGTGLGLPVSQKLLREHGGEIRVESTVGVGSKFVLEIPAVLVAASTDTLHGETLPG